MDKHQNNAAHPEVAIFFEDQKINMLLSSLLESRGISTRIVTCAEQLDGTSKVVTEPQFFSKLKSRSKQSCLLIGNQDAVEGAEAITLTRPLTESKIEIAISEFLRA